MSARIEWLRAMPGWSVIVFRRLDTGQLWDVYVRDDGNLFARIAHYLAWLAEDGMIKGEPTPVVACVGWERAPRPRGEQLDLFEVAK